MLQREWRALGGAALLILTGSAAQAHHPMGYATPATALDGFLSGLGHPVIGIDHLLFVAAAGVVAARVRGGALLPLWFVVPSVLAVGLRSPELNFEAVELWIAASLIGLAGFLLIFRELHHGPIAALFSAAGALHGFALAEAVVGAEPTPLIAYLVGLAVIQSAIAFACWKAATWAATRHPGFPLQRVTAAVVALGGLGAAALAIAASVA